MKYTGKYRALYLRWYVRTDYFKEYVSILRGKGRSDSAVPA